MAAKTKKKAMPGPYLEARVKVLTVRDAVRSVRRRAGRFAGGGARAAGASLEAVRLLAGHGNLHRTQRYVHAAGAELAAAIAKLSGN